MATLIWVMVWFGIAWAATSILYAAFLILKLGYSFAEVIGVFKNL